MLQASCIVNNPLLIIYNSENSFAFAPIEACALLNTGRASSRLFACHSRIVEVALRAFETTLLVKILRGVTAKDVISGK
jgi:hypothetical protein